MIKIFTNELGFLYEKGGANYRGVGVSAIIRCVTKKVLIYEIIRE